ncbi:MAG TPA: DUF308 domain-containing protein [Devosiaceae bacterium]|nr:DUF308 domain-containing protein [Devosiaceae bacterium]
MSNPDATMGPRVDSMNGALADNWWALALRGAFAILFSLIAFFLPGVTMLSLVLVFAAYSFVDGIFSVCRSSNTRRPLAATCRAAEPRAAARTPPRKANRRWNGTAAHAYGKAVD